MIIAGIMTKNPVFVSPDLSVNDTKALMTREKIQKLPVLNKNNELVGIVTQKELLNAGPSAATTLDMYEISYLLSKLKVANIMNKNVISVQETETIEEAARIMADNHIGCLPVMKGKLLVGIITESDLFRTFVDLFGARHVGIRVTFSLDEKPGQLAVLTKAIADKNGNIISLVTSEGDDVSKRRVTCRIADLDMDSVKAIYKQLDIKIEDIR
ncbi:MAG: CBS domain-containing protein [Spirochaetaceae bacterium]|nr:CBS domain-containing protein [Spirochaetaceae bacterium]MBP5329179.1 CBS domain-containing protein [Spirochaetaceae bacterium]